MASTFAPKTESAANYAFLKAAGWRAQGMNRHTRRMEWRHRSLNWLWPTNTAIQLQREADQGGKETVHRMLRGEA